MILLTGILVEEVPTGVKPGFLILIMSSSSSEGLLSFLSLLNMSSEAALLTLIRLNILCSYIIS